MLFPIVTFITTDFVDNYLPCRASNERGAAAFFVSRVPASLARGQPASVCNSLSNSSQAQCMG
jgi:hypothetical protein